MTRITFYVGIDRDRNNKHLRLLEIHDGLISIEGILTREYGGFTKVAAQGRYQSGPDEASRIYTVITSRDLPNAGEIAVMEIAGKLADCLDQESVLYTLEEVKGGFAYGSKKS
jgi:hypothetical protein